MNSRFRRLSSAYPLVVLLAGVPPTAVIAMQVTAPQPPPGSLVVDPQQGATPRPIGRDAAAPLPSTPVTALPSPAPTAPIVNGPAIPLQPIRGDLPEGGQPGVMPLTGWGGLPAPSGDPLALDPKTDPILRLALASADPDAFRQAIRSVVRRNPSAAEAVAQSDEARAVRNEARASQYPIIDLSLSHFQVLDRAFSNDPQNVLERSRPGRRTDALVRAQQPIIDFGTARNRISAGNRRVEASVAAIDESAMQIAMRGISVWYQLFAYRALVSLSAGFVEGQAALKGAIQQRVQQGYAAPGDVAQVESYIAAAQAQLANYRRQLASAEAQYRALTGSPAPSGFGRAPAASSAGVTLERAQSEAEGGPAVRIARLNADAARYDTNVAKANALPGVTVGVDAGRYGVFETNNDFDIRGSVTFSQRLGGGAVQRISAAKARARGAQAAYDRVREDALRDVAIAWADVKALEEAEAAIRDNYIATRQSRDVLAERFRVSRGTLFDLLGAEANYFNVAARYVEAVTELDIARYSLLARRGKLLDAFDIEPARLDRR